MKKFQMGIIFLLLLFFVIGFLIGKNYDRLKITVLEDYIVTVNDDIQVFRDAMGKKMYPIQYDSNIYIPINQMGTFLNYTAILKEEALKLYSFQNNNGSLKILDDLNTLSINGDTINNSIFTKKDYTIIFIMADWCPNCKDEILELEKFCDTTIIDYQILTIPLGLHLNDMKNIKNNKIIEDSKKLLQNLKNNTIIYMDQALIQNLVGNSVSIPKLAIFDSDRNLVKILEDNPSSKQLEEIMEIIEG